METDGLDVIREESLGTLRVIRAKLTEVIDAVEKASTPGEMTKALWKGMNATDETMTFDVVRDLRDRSSQLEHKGKDDALPA